MTILRFFTSKLGLYALAVLAVVGFGLWLRWDAVQDERQERVRDELQRRIDTRERIDNATSDDRTSDDVDRRLRELAE